MKRPVQLVLLVCGPFGLAVACNGIIGADAPHLVAGDASPDGFSPDAPTEDAGDSTTSESSTDGTSPDVTADSFGESSVDAPSDARTDAFDGACTCASPPCPPVVMAGGQPDPTRLAVDATGLYWTNEVPTQTMGGGSVWHVNLDGTSAAAVVPAVSLPFGVAVGGGDLYWTELGQVSQCTLPGCGITTSLTTPPINPQQLALTPAALFWTNTTGTASIGAYEIGAMTTKAIATSPQAPFSIATDGINVYFTGSSAVYECPVDGSRAPVVVGTSTSPSRIATDGVNVYWTDSSDGAVYACPVAGGCGATPNTLFGGLPSPGGIAVDHSSLYVTTSDSVVRGSVAGGPTVVIAMQGAPRDLVTGDTCVYWLDSTPDAGTVFASAK